MVCLLSPDADDLVVQSIGIRFGYREDELMNAQTCKRRFRNMNRIRDPEARKNRIISL
jgi:hypothetical protein